MTAPSGDYQVGPFDVEHVLLTWGGKLPGDEQWSCSLRLAEQDTVGGLQVPSQAEVSSWLNGSLRTAVSDYHQRAGTHINGYCLLSFAKANRINVDGTYKDQDTNEYIFADLPGGQAGYAAPMPNQLSVAVSLTTGYSRGPAHRGRFYLPLYGGAIDAATGGMPTQTANEIRDSSKTFLEAVADIPGFDSPVSLTPCVMSRKQGSPAHRPITGVEVGHVVDTQRRRRRSLPERYVKVDLDLGAN